MSGNKPTDGEDEVGYGKPPREHQFKKGESGNRRGRPKKRARALLPSQAYIDILAAAEEPIKIKINGKPQQISGIEAIVLGVRNKALGGHMPAARHFCKLYSDSLDQFYESNKRQMENLEQMRAFNLVTANAQPPKEVLDFMARCFEQSKRIIKT